MYMCVELVYGYDLTLRYDDTNLPSGLTAKAFNDTMNEWFEIYQLISQLGVINQKGSAYTGDPILAEFCSTHKTYMGYELADIIKQFDSAYNGGGEMPYWIGTRISGYDAPEAGGSPLKAIREFDKKVKANRESYSDISKAALNFSIEFISFLTSHPESHSVYGQEFVESLLVIQDTLVKFRSIEPQELELSSSS